MASCRRMLDSVSSVSDVGVLQILCEGVEHESANDDAGTEDWTMGCDRKCEGPKNRAKVESEQLCSTHHLPKWAGQYEG